MISILFLSLLITLTFSAAQGVCRGDPNLDFVMEAADYEKLAGIFPDDTKVNAFDGKSTGEFVLNVRALDQNKIFKSTGNAYANDEKYKPMRVEAQKRVFTASRMDGDVDQLGVIPTRIYEGGNTQLCWSTAQPNSHRYYFGSGAESHLCTLTHWMHYSSNPRGNVYYYIFENKCSTATPKATGPIAAGHPLFPPTDTAAPAAVYQVKKKSPDHKHSNVRTLKIYTDGTMAYFEEANQKGSFYMTGAASYIDKDGGVVDNVGDAKYLKVPRRRIKNGAENVEDILFKKEDGLADLAQLKASLDAVFNPNYDTMWQTECGSCGSKYINLAIHNKKPAAPADKFDTVMHDVYYDPFDRISSINSIEQSSLRSFGAVVIFAVLAVIFATYAICGKANKEDDAYEHLIAQEI